MVREFKSRPLHHPILMNSLLGGLYLRDSETDSDISKEMFTAPTGPLEFHLLKS